MTSQVAHNLLPRNLAGPASMMVIIAVIGTTGCVRSGVGPVSIRQASTWSGSAMAGDQKLGVTVLTYNIWGLPSWMNLASPKRYAQIASDLERLQPDLVMLQEVWTETAFRSVPTNGEWAVARTPHSNFFHRNGLVILSRFPIIDGEFLSFDSAAFPDSLVHKGALKVTVRLPDGQRLNVWNVHLQAGGFARVRSRQIAQLAGWVREAEDGQIADLVAGDFNSKPDSPQFQQLYRDVGETAQQIVKMDYFPTYDGLSRNPKHAETLDYVFIRPRSDLKDMEAAPSLAFANADRRQRLSDHVALEVAFRFHAEANLASLPLTNQVARSSVAISARAPEGLGY